MKRTLWRLTAASTGALVALSLNVGAAGALSPGDQHPPERIPHGPVQVGRSVARTDQDARSFAKSEQIMPINANVPVQILSLGHNGGDTKQSNSSSASSAAVNKAGTEQSIDQHQKSYPKAHVRRRRRWTAGRPARPRRDTARRTTARRVTTARRTTTGRTVARSTTAVGRTTTRRVTAPRVTRRHRRCRWPTSTPGPTRTPTRRRSRSSSCPSTPTSRSSS